jgi:hypothetical protein
MRTRGLPEERRIHCHGQGYELVERPLIRHDESMAIAESMHIAVHPGVANARVFASRTECYLIGPDGAGRGLHATSPKIVELA